MRPSVHLASTPKSFRVPGVTGIEQRLRRPRARFVEIITYGQMFAGPEAGAGGPSPGEIGSTSEMRPRWHSFGGPGAFHRAPSECPRQSTRALLGVKMCPSARRELAMWSQPPPPTEPEAKVANHRCIGCLDRRHLARMVRSPTEFNVRVEPTSRQPPGLRVRTAPEPQYQNLDELRKRPEYANLDEISREFGYRLCPEGQNLEDEAIYENILSVRRIRSAEVRLVPMSEVPYYEGQGYIATQVLSRSGTFPQCPPQTWSRMQQACRETGSLRIFTVIIISSFIFLLQFRNF